MGSGVGYFVFILFLGLLNLEFRLGVLNIYVIFGESFRI